MAESLLQGCPHRLLGQAHQLKDRHIGLEVAEAVADVGGRLLLAEVSLHLVVNLPESPLPVSQDPPGGGKLLLQPLQLGLAELPGGHRENPQALHGIVLDVAGGWR